MKPNKGILKTKRKWTPWWIREGGGGGHVERTSVSCVRLSVTGRGEGKERAPRLALKERPARTHGCFGFGESEMAARLASWQRQLLLDAPSARHYCYSYNSVTVDLPPSAGPSTGTQTLGAPSRLSPHTRRTPPHNGGEHPALMSVLKATQQ